MFRSAATKLAHNSTIPAFGGNSDLKPLQDLILAEKQVLVSLQKLSSDLAKSAEALRIWGSGEGDDLGDILGASSTLIALWASAVSQFAAHGHPMRDYLKSIRTREEKLDELKRRRKSVSAKAEAAEKKLSKMSPEHKNITIQTDSLNALRAEIRSMDSDIMTEEAAIGDFKRSTTRAWMGLKFGGLLECSEKGTIAGEYGKLIISEIPEEQTQPGMARSLYYGRNKTEQLLSEAHRCINEVVMSTVATPNAQQGFQQPQLTGQQFQQPQLTGQQGYQQPQPLYTQHTQQSTFQAGPGYGAPQLPINTPQSMFQVPGMVGSGGQTPQAEWAPPPNNPNEHHSYLSTPQGLGTGQFLDQTGSPSPPQQYPSQVAPPNVPYQHEEHTSPPPRSVDDFGINTGPSSQVEQTAGTGGRFATFPVKNRGYALADSQARDSGSFSSSVAQALSSSQSPPGTLPQPSFSYDVSQQGQGFMPPPGPPPENAPNSHLSAHHEERVHSDDEAGLAYMADEQRHEDATSRHVRFGETQDVNIDDEHQRRASHSNGDVVEQLEQEVHQGQNLQAAPVPEHQPPHYDTIPPINEPAQSNLEIPPQVGAESGHPSPTTDTRFQNQRRVPPPSIDPAEDERSLNAAAAREVSRELDALHFNPPILIQDQERFSISQGPPASQTDGGSLIPPSVPFTGAPSPNTDSPTLPYSSNDTPQTTYNQQQAYTQEPLQYQQQQPRRPSYDSQSATPGRISLDDPPRLPSISSSPYQTPYATPGEYPRGLGISSPANKSSTSVNSQVPAGARTISAAAFKRPQRMVSTEIPPASSSLADTSPLQLKKRLPSSPYPQNREGSPIRRARSGSPALPAAPAPSQALPPIPKDEEDYDYLSAYVDTGAPEGPRGDAPQSERGRGYGEGRFATDLEGALQ